MLNHIRRLIHKSKFQICVMGHAPGAPHMGYSRVHVTFRLDNKGENTEWCLGDQHQIYPIILQANHDIHHH